MHVSLHRAPLLRMRDKRANGEIRRRREHGMTTGKTHAGGFDDVRDEIGPWPCEAKLQQFAKRRRAQHCNEQHGAIERTSW